MYTYTAIKHKEKFWNVKNSDSAVINGTSTKKISMVSATVSARGRIYIVGGLRQV